ncbi:MAG TPA: trypsin-like peptidase domain-containing protein, partial [Clostridia bacterium]|nr:trypsin-like peptidase domain-containing protein [Clostridia bacterium]
NKNDHTENNATQPENRNASERQNPNPNHNGNAYGHYNYNPYGQNGYQQNFSSNNNPQEYQWKFEDYESTGRKNPRPPKKPGGLAVIGALLGTVLLVGVLCLSGYGIYSLWHPSIVDGSSEQSASSTDENSTNTPQLAIKDHPTTSSDTLEVVSNGKLSTVQIASKVRPSVVGIAQYSAQDTFTPSGEGSGIIMNNDGYIITNAHVVEGSTGINVELDNGETYSARLIGIDTKTDLAVIKIEAPDLIAAEFGNSDTLEVGETVVAIGNPGGSTLAGSVTQGIVSAVNRMIKDGGYSSSFIQTDAAINPGNSGGALVNEYGQVIGINSSKIAAVDYEGIGFAIPISEAKPVIDQLMAYGYVKGRTKIGISGVEINQTLSQINSIPVGIYIQAIDPTSDLAGKNVKQGDIITSIDGTKIETFDDVSTFLKTKSPGDNVTLTLYRSARGVQGSGQTFSVSMKLMEDVDNATMVSHQ